jgi:hypothetical protein
MTLARLIALIAVSAAAGEPEFSDVFRSGAEGYVSIRIPAVLVTRAGTVLAFAEGRRRPVDQAENDIVMKRSTDGGATWSPAIELPELTDPSCMAGLLRYSFDDGAGLGRLLHTGPDSTKRERGTVWLSLDDGATWPVKRVLWPGAFAYSVPARLADGSVGVLFEADKRIVFARFSIGWVETEHSQQKARSVPPVVIRRIYRK